MRPDCRWDKGTGRISQDACRKCLKRPRFPRSVSCASRQAKRRKVLEPYDKTHSGSYGRLEECDKGCCYICEPCKDTCSGPDCTSRCPPFSFHLFRGRCPDR